MSARSSNHDQGTRSRPRLGAVVRLTQSVIVFGLLMAAVGCNEKQDVASPHASPPESPEPSAENEDGSPQLDPALHTMVVMIQRGQTHQARDAIQRFLAENPQHGQAEFLLGLTHHQEFRYSLARPHFERAVELAPSYHPTYHFLGWCLYHLGEASDARTMMEEHLAHMPEEGDSHYVIGLIDMELGSINEAEARFRKAIQLQQGMPGREGSLANAHASLGQLLAQQHEFDEAREQLEAAVLLNPQHDEAWYQLYRLFLRIGDEEKAELARERYEQASRQRRRGTGFPE